MPDAVDSHNIARRTFEVARRGYEQQEVRGYLHEISAVVERLQRETAQLKERAERAESRLDMSDGPDEAMLLEVLGEETTRVLTSAKDAAAEIRAKAEAAAEKIVSSATLEASEARADAVRDAEHLRAEATAERETLLAEARAELESRRIEAQDAAAVIRAEASEQSQALRDEAQGEADRIRESAEDEVEAARVRGKEMVAEAQAVRERVLRDLAVRRKKARLQVERLNAGRERLLEAYTVVRRTIDEATDELSTSLSDARLAADAAARRIEEEPEPSLEQLDEEIRAAGLVDLPITDHDDHEELDDGPSPLSGEVPVVDAGAPSEPEAAPEPEPVAETTPPVDLGERRGRKRRRKETFEGLPDGKLDKVDPPAEGEGVRVIEDAPEETTEPAEPTDDLPTAEAEPEAGVDDLFARLRAEQGDDAAPAEADDDEAAATEDAPPEAVADAEPEPEPEPEPPAVTPFTERDALLKPIEKELARRLKRTLADEQNEVLDLLRRAKPAGVDDLLPDADAHAGRWMDVAGDALADSAAAGATWSDGGGAIGPTADLADELARSLTAPLRERIDRSFSAADGNLDDVADRVRALYREWKGQRLDETSRHYAAAAYARGAFESLPHDAQVHWVVDPSGGPCPDCDDNVLGGEVVKGTEFPTGHACAPAHPGCRCLVLAVNR